MTDRATKLYLALGELYDSVCDYITELGIKHSDPKCPEDDTCECRPVHRINDAINAARKALEYQPGRVRSAEQVQSECDCGPCGSAETYATQVLLPIAGRVRPIDKCIHDIIAALNAADITTVASCCGHGKIDGRITLEDGRELLVVLPGVRDVP